MAIMITKPHNIYIHVPFCKARCNYCAFFSQACANPDWDTYTNGIIRELESWNKRLGCISVPTIFFGGGTPSYMPGAIFGQIMDAIAKNFDIDAGAEITAECNPGTIDKEKLKEFIAAGMNRISIGVQRLDDNELKFMGRIHNTHDAMQLIDLAMSQKLRVSADFIYGIPGDTAQNVAKMCTEINKIGLQHCSMYELSIEAGTPFASANLTMPGNEEMAQMYSVIGTELNLPRYEVSNHAADGNECRHNQNIWDGAPYIGIGRGAAGRVYIDGTWYEQMGAGQTFRQMTLRDRAVEKIITGMRTTRGVQLTPDVAMYIDMGYIAMHPELISVTDDGRIVATDMGILILDKILLELIR